MEITKTAINLAKAGKIDQAYHLLLDGADRGDADAAFLMAQWRMEGDLVRRDLKESRRLYRIASRHGHREGHRRYLALLANGAGGIPRHWNKAVELLREGSEPVEIRQASLIDAMQLDDHGDPVSAIRSIVTKKSPRLCRIPSFLTRDECEYLIQTSETRLQPSMVVHPQTGKLVSDPVRASSIASYPFINEDPVIHALNRRISSATRTHYEQGEPLQVLSYRPGQFYRLHSDALPNEPNQRILTFLVYLNENYVGGSTDFPRIGWSFRGKQGDALMFYNTTPLGEPDPMAIHAGNVVQQGQKIILSKWIRSGPLDLRGPPGRPF